MKYTFERATTCNMRLPCRRESGLPKFLDPALRAIMEATHIGMQLTVWLRKSI